LDFLAKGMGLDFSVMLAVMLQQGLFAGKVALAGGNG
jgi:hypothetical protein